MQLHKKNHILLLLEHTAVVKNNELWNGSQDLMKKQKNKHPVQKNFRLLTSLNPILSVLPYIPQLLPSLFHSPEMKHNKN